MQVGPLSDVKGGPLTGAEVNYYYCYYYCYYYYYCYCTDIVQLLLLLLFTLLLLLSLLLVFLLLLLPLLLPLLFFIASTFDNCYSHLGCLGQAGRAVDTGDIHAPAKRNDGLLLRNSI